MVSSWLERFHIKVLVCRGRLGSLLISSRMEMLDAALRKRGSDSLFSMSIISFTERLIFLGTEESLVILSRTWRHCLMTSADSFNDTRITFAVNYDIKIRANRLV